MDLTIGDFTTEICEAGSGPAVVFCHGSASDRRTWSAQHDALTANNYRMISYSRRYHWPNPPATDETNYSMGQHVADLAELITTVATEPAHLVGHSYGGFTALLTAQRHPELVRSLVMIEPPVVPLFLSDPPKPAELARVLVRQPRLGVAMIKFGATGIVPATKAASNRDMDKAIQIFGKAVLGKEAFERLSPERMEQVQANNIRAEYLSESFDPLTTDEVRSVTAPSLVVSGQRSPRLWTMLADQLDALLPNSQRVEIPNASHIVHEDNPDDFTTRLLAFLASEG